MRQRHVVVYLWLIAAFYVATMIAGFLVMDHIKYRPAPFVDPAIWREPMLDDGEEQLQPEI